MLLQHSGVQYQPATMALCGSESRSASEVCRKNPVRWAVPPSLPPPRPPVNAAFSRSRCCLRSRQIVNAQPTAWLSRSPWHTANHEHVNTAANQSRRVKHATTLLQPSSAIVHRQLGSNKQHRNIATRSCYIYPTNATFHPYQTNLKTAPLLTYALGKNSCDTNREENAMS